MMDNYNNYLHHGKHDHDPKQENLSPLISKSKLQSDHRLVKRDEWSEGGISCLLEAYEAKWALRNRAKLKGQDWDDVAKLVSSRSKKGGTKSHKTLTQCKNKIESMKKRYRSEAAAMSDADVAASSSWPLFHRLDLLMRGNSSVRAGPTMPSPSSLQIMSPPLQGVIPRALVVNSRGGSNIGGNLNTKQGDVTPDIKSSDDEHVQVDTGSSTPALYNKKEGEEEEVEKKKVQKGNSKKRKM